MFHYFVGCYCLEAVCKGCFDPPSERLDKIFLPYAKQIEAQIENADSPSISAGKRIAIRGAILTDLRRMLNEVHDMVAMTSDSFLSEHDAIAASDSAR
jgi:hypothetical protein